MVTGPADEPPIKFDLRRTIGLLMLNLIGIKTFNHVGTLYFNVSDYALSALKTAILISAVGASHRRSPPVARRWWLSSDSRFTRAENNWARRCKTAIASLRWRFSGRHRFVLTPCWSKGD